MVPWEACPLKAQILLKIVSPTLLHCKLESRESTAITTPKGVAAGWVQPGDSPSFYEHVLLECFGGRKYVCWDGEAPNPWWS